MTSSTSPRPTPSPTPAALARRPNRRGEGGRLRDDIVRAATRLLQEGGSEQVVTLRAVAREAGIATPSIYPHFPDPSAIIAAVVAETFAALTATLRASREGIDDPVWRLTAQCDAYLRFAAEHPGLYRVLFVRDWGVDRRAVSSVAGRGATRATTRNDAVILEAGTPTFDLLVEAIAGCVAAGRSASEDPFMDALALWSALHGYIALRAAAPEFPWPDERTTINAIISGQARLLPLP